MSISLFFEQELAHLKEKILSMGALVVEQVVMALRAYATQDVTLARQTIQNDHLVNAMDVAIDEEGLRLLALYHPAASDLRFITTAMKIATDLERMSDLAEDICERALELAGETPLKKYTPDMCRMMELSQKMVKEALDAFVQRDSSLARQVCAQDEAVDQLTQKIFVDLLSDMSRESAITTRAIRVSFVAKYIERIADHATNIAEVVVYLVEGKIIRHTVV